MRSQSRLSADEWDFIDAIAVIAAYTWILVVSSAAFVDTIVYQRDVCTELAICCGVLFLFSQLLLTYQCVTTPFAGHSDHFLIRFFPFVATMVSIMHAYVRPVSAVHMLQASHGGAVTCYATFLTNYLLVLAYVVVLVVYNLLLCKGICRHEE